MNHLTKNDLAFIGIRLLAVYFTVNALGTVSTLAFAFTSMSGVPFYLKYMTIFYHALYLVVPVILWITANKLANFLTTEKNAHNVQAVSSNAKDLQAILLTVIGVYLLATTLPVLAGSAFEYMHQMNQSKNINFDIPMPGTRESVVNAGMVINLTKLFLSLVLIFSARSLSALFTKLRYAGR